MIPSLKGWLSKAKETTSPHEVRLTLQDTNPVFQCLGNKSSFRDSNVDRGLCTTEKSEVSSVNSLATGR